MQIIQKLKNSRLPESDKRLVERRLTSNGFSVEEFTRIVDESPFSLEEWFSAWAAMENFLAQKKLSADPNIMRGYLQCCSAALAHLGKPPIFSEHVEEMLSRHGFLGAVKE